MAKITMSGRGSAADIAAKISQGLHDSALSSTLVDNVSHKLDGNLVIVMVFEKYYMRTSNRASLTVVIVETDGIVTVDAIGSGGGQGALFRFSWGADEDFVGTAAGILRQNGFS